MSRISRLAAHFFRPDGQLNQIGFVFMLYCNTGMLYLHIEAWHLIRHLFKF